VLTTRALVSRIAIGGIFLVSSVVHSSTRGSNLEPPSGVEFEVVSSRIVDKHESIQRSPPDVLGLDLAVRLRLCSTAFPAYVLIPADPILARPLGYSVITVDGEHLWRTHTVQGGLSRTSPGLAVITRMSPTEWLLLAPGSCLEWEIVTGSDSEPPGTAYTAFVKESSFDAPVREVISSVPEGPKS
jgi:hypothetical protein